MDTSETVDSRLVELEIKASLVEDLVDRLNETVVRQQERIDLLIREVGRLGRERDADVEPGAPRVRDDVPPHY
jgi:SlyX protein